jgi:hypothetical protein
MAWFNKSLNNSLKASVRLHEARPNRNIKGLKERKEKDHQCGFMDRI